MRETATPMPHWKSRTNISPFKRIPRHVSLSFSFILSHPLFLSFSFLSLRCRYSSSPHPHSPLVARCAIYIPGANACVCVGISVTSVNGGVSTSKNVVCRLAVSWPSPPPSSSAGEADFGPYMPLPYPVTLRPKKPVCAPFSHSPRTTVTYTRTPCIRERGEYLADAFSK